MHNGEIAQLSRESTPHLIICAPVYVLLLLVDVVICEVHHLHQRKRAFVEAWWRRLTGFDTSNDNKVDFLGKDVGLQILRGLLLAPVVLALVLIQQLSRFE